ncbi:MAG: hypothetical protein QOG50_1142 [Actinomycetota bacterium]|nr:hypothetical protein [Actinomycetota bacterium]
MNLLPLYRCRLSYRKSWSVPVTGQDTTETQHYLLDHRGYGRAYPIGRRQIVGSVTHLCDGDDYRWLNNSIAVSMGEVRTIDNATELVIDVAELVWQPLEP